MRRRCHINTGEVQRIQRNSNHGIRNSRTQGLGTVPLTLWRVEWGVNWFSDRARKFSGWATDHDSVTIRIMLHKDFLPARRKDLAWAWQAWSED